MDTISPTLISPSDTEFAHENFNAMCGHGALAAALGIPVVDAMQYFESGGWVSIPVMTEALRRSGRTALTMHGFVKAPLMALTIIQFTGSWMRPEVNVAARCRYRHWVATKDGLVWDMNEPRWQPKADWERDLIPQLLPSRATGWEPVRSLVW